MTSLYILAHNLAERLPKNEHVTLHFHQKDLPSKHGYQHHTGRLNTNEAKDTTFHLKTIIIE